jgi:hypothetical protein
VAWEPVSLSLPTGMRDASVLETSLLASLSTP